MAYLLGIDVGTSGCKAVLLDETGEVIACGTASYPMHQERDGWAEQDPETWWAGACQAIGAALNGQADRARQMKAIGLTGQLHSPVLLDGKGTPLRRAILWCDNRSAEACRAVERLCGGRERLCDASGNPALTGFTAGKLQWVRQHEPEVWARTHTVLMPKDYVRFRLTGTLATDETDASGTNLMDIRTRRWSPPLLRALDAEGRMPPILPSGQLAGYVTPQAAAQTGLRAGIAVAAGAGDNLASAVGMGVAEAQTAMLSLGTSGVLLALTQAPPCDMSGRVQTYAAAEPAMNAAICCTLAAGLSVRWVRDTCWAAEARAHPGEVYALMARAAEASPVGAGRLLFLPYLMGERSPLLDDRVRGGFIGLSAAHDRGDLTRAVLEGVAFALRQNMDLLRAMGIAPRTLRVCGGGAKNGLWLQILADVMERDIVAASNPHAAATGAAMLGARAIGMALTPKQGSLRQYAPRQAAVERYEPYYRLFCQLYPALKAHYEHLAGLP